MKITLSCSVSISVGRSDVGSYLCVCVCGGGGGDGLVYCHKIILDASHNYVRKLSRLSLVLVCSLII